ncbi:translation initiation factor IF-2 [Halosquirtibacter xylanolyticus]|uniref:translation initiation factor IF-2 n=1 Tax=Halosquirtibacter xylanolyticus TaxID=3374599 RepID=UPI003747C210|nr:translation initiation factor IF-2 [Prolixibacteraceae bacterium]
MVSEGKRLSKVAKELNVGISTITDFLQKKGFDVKLNPNTKIEPSMVKELESEFRNDHDLKKASEKVHLRPNSRKSKESTTSDNGDDVGETPKNESAPVPEAPPAQVEKVSGSVKKEETVEESVEKPKLKVLGKIELPSTKKPKKEKKSPEQKKAIEPTKTLPKESPVAKTTSETIQHKAKKEVSSKKELKEKSPEVRKKKAVDEQRVIETAVKEKPQVELSTLQEASSSDITNKTDKGLDKPKEESNERMTKENGKTDQANKPATTTKDDVFHTERQKLSGPKVVGKIELPVEKKTDKSSKSDKNKKKRKRLPKEKVDINAKGGEGANKGPGNRGKGGPRGGQGQNGPRNGQGQNGNNNNKDANGNNTNNRNRPGQAGAQNRNNSQRPNNRKNIKGGRKPIVKKEVTEEDVQKQIKDTLARLTSKGKSKGSKHRRDKRQAASEKVAKEEAVLQQDKKVLKVTEFVSVSELATMMDVTATQVIATCMNLGTMVSINQRLDAETLNIVAEEFGYKVDFISVEVQEAIAEEVDKDEDMDVRPPIITVMGHVDHGKTSLLDYVRKANVIAGEAGGITQHIGAYNVTLEDGRKITFLDTPGHEAFTAMRARGAQVTDVAIIIVAADDNVMPQTIEAINHASAAGVPIVFAINKVDRDAADPERIKSELANLNYMVEDWGGKYQSQEISAKTGMGVSELLDKVLLESEMLDLKANPNKRAIGSVIESSLDRGRGYTSTILVESGSLRVGDVILAGPYHGHVKAMFNERNQQVKVVGPSEPVLILGLNGAPQAGDKFNCMESEREARQIANKREQLQREQGLRTQKHITLDEIGRRIAIGNFQELNVIVKGDVDGSIEALSDSLIKLSTEEIQVNIIHKAVGQISESDVMLATASNAIVVGFQVRPSMGARKLAEKEEIDIRLYSIIYDAIEEVKSAMEGMLSPEIKEEIIATVEIRETFKISKVGTIAGCFVREGKISRNSKIRLIRDGIVVYTGELAALKRFKDDVKEVTHGYECGISIEKYNDLRVDDIIEAYELVEIAKKL